MTRQNSTPISFRVYPDSNRYLYMVVNIWPTKKSMQQYDRLGRNHEASCGGRESRKFKSRGRGRKMLSRKTGLFAEANFYRGRLGVEVVSHEMTHAAFAWADRRRVNLGEVDKEWKVRKRPATMSLDGPEERFCYALGRMCRQFTAKCYDLGLYQEVVKS